MFPWPVLIRYSILTPIHLHHSLASAESFPELLHLSLSAGELRGNGMKCEAYLIRYGVDFLLHRTPQSVTLAGLWPHFLRLPGRVCRD